MKVAIMEDLILDEDKKDIEVAVESFKGKEAAAEERKDADGDANQNEETAVTLETFIENSFVNASFDDVDVSFFSLFELDDLFFSKVDVMKFDFAYLCDVLPNGYVHCDDHFMHIFDINST